MLAKIRYGSVCRLKDGSMLNYAVYGGGSASIKAQRKDLKIIFKVTKYYTQRRCELIAPGYGYELNYGVGPLYVLADGIKILEEKPNKEVNHDTIAIDTQSQCSNGSLG